MRLTRAENLLRLAIWLQGSYGGVTLQNIQHEFNVSRRTAERMRDALSRLLPGLVEVQTDGPRKRWRIPKSKSLLPVRVTAEELASVVVGARLLERENLSSHATRLRDVERKLRALDGGRRATGREVDLEALLEAEGLALRLGPRPRINAGVLHGLRQSILRCHKVVLHYLAQGSGQVSRQRVCPYGFLYGEQPYLVAYSANPQIRDYRLFRLANIQSIDFLDQPYTRREDFSLQAYAEQSFGIFQGRQYQVELEFSKESATDAMTCQFHPDQEMTPLENGKLRVKMRGSGLRELAWYLLRWGDAVRVIRPKRLKSMLRPVQKAMAKSEEWG